MDTAPTLLEIKDFGLTLSTEEGDKVLLHNIDLLVPAGGFVTLTGKSGCGKTVLARSIAGLLPSSKTQTRGSQYFCGTALEKNRLKKILGNEIAMVFQQPGLSFDPVMSLGKQLIEIYSQHSKDTTSQARDKVRAWLEKFNLGDLDRIMKAYPHQLSGGQLQRLSLAAATIHQPKLLIADEATSALDADNERAILDLILELKKNTGMAVLWISHDLSTALPVSDYIYVMDEGRMIEEAPTNKFRETAESPVSRELLSAVYTPTWSAASDEQPLLQLHGITKGYSATNLFQGFNLQLNAGQRMAITGPSGSGKSTLARIIAGVEDVDAGQVTWHPLQGRYLSKVQMIFQQPALSLNPKMTIAQSLAEPYRIHHLPFNRSTLVEKLGEVMLPENVLDRYPHQLSGGQLQRVCIARSLVLLPQILILDEAVTALDAVNKVQILYLLDHMHQKYNMALLMITHDQELARLFCKEVIAIS